MELSEIDGMIVDGQVVYYKRGEVIAIGVAAARFVRLQGGRIVQNGIHFRHHPDPPDPETFRALVERDTEEGEPDPLVDLSLSPAIRFTGVVDPERTVTSARSRGLRVQLNHVLFAHCGCCCDPCCSANPYGAFPLKATPLKATPLKATPLKATAELRTTAKPTGTETIKDPPELSNVVHVWILDTGMSDDTFTTPIDSFVTGDPKDAPDRHPPQGDGDVDPVAGHGSFIAGIIHRIAPGCTIRIEQVVDTMGHVTESDAADMIDNLVNAGMNDGVDLRRTLLNLSFGGSLVSDETWRLREAIAAAQEAGIVVVASAGNDASCLPVYPGNFPGVTAVGAVDADGVPAGFTNRGTWVDACALGVDIVSTFFKFEEAVARPGFPTGWATWSGTSFSTPVVVAAIAQEMATEPSAQAARDAVLVASTPMPCLGVKVEPDDVQSLQPSIPHNS